MFENFPKVRPALPLAYQQVYKQHYFENRAGTGLFNALAQHLEGWMHRKISARGNLCDSQSVLDFGCGNLNHLRFENRHRIYDAVEPFQELYSGSNKEKLVNTIYGSVHDIEDRKYDRILSVAVLEHLEDLPATETRTQASKTEFARG